MLGEREGLSLTGKEKQNKKQEGKQNFLRWDKLADLLLKLLKVTSVTVQLKANTQRVFTSRNRIRVKKENDLLGDLGSQLCVL